MAAATAPDHLVVVGRRAGAPLDAHLQRPSRRSPTGLHHLPLERWALPTSGTLRSADSTSLAWKRVPWTADEVLEAAAPQAPDRGLAARARLAQDGARLLEVVAQQPVVTVERGDDQVAPLAVGDLLAGGGVDGLDDGPVLVEVRAGQPCRMPPPTYAKHSAPAVMSGMPLPMPNPGIPLNSRPASLGSMPILAATSKNRPVEKPMNGMSGFTRVQKRRPCSASSSVSGGGTQMLSMPKYS